MMSITELFKNAQDTKKIVIDEKISGSHGAVVGVGRRLDGHIGVAVMDRPIKSARTLAFINASVNSMKGEISQDLDR